MIKVQVGDHSPQASLAACLQVMLKEGWHISEIDDDRFLVGLAVEDRVHVTCGVTNEQGTLVLNMSDRAYVLEDESINLILSLLETENTNSLEEWYSTVVSEHDPLTNEQFFAPSFKFSPGSTHLVSTVLMVINIAVFVLMLLNDVDWMSPDSSDLIAWGANYGPAVYTGEYWRLLSSCFVHIGIIHLAFNMYALYYIGLILEEIIGSLRFIVAYLIVGIVGSTASFWWHGDHVSAGASGAIFGMYGLFLALLVFKVLSPRIVSAFLTSILAFVGYSLLIGMKDGIDNAAHIGGLLSGFVLGLAWLKRSSSKSTVFVNNKIFYLLTVLMLAGSFGFVAKTSAKFNSAFAAFEVFSENEKAALQLYNINDSVGPDSIKSFIINVGIPKWQKAREVLEEADSTDIGPELMERRRKLIEYTRLRERSFEILRDNVHNPDFDNSPEFAEQQRIFLEIQELINHLNAE